MPLAERLDQRTHAFVALVAKAARSIEGVALHGRIRKVEPVLAQPLRGLEAARVGDPGQLRVDPLVELLANVRLIRREREVREAHQAPVQAPPLSVRIGLRLRREVEEG